MDRGDPSSKASDASGFFFGLAIGFTAFAILLSSKAVERFIEHGNPTPHWTGIPLGVIVVAAGLIWGVRERSAWSVALVIAGIPLFVAANVVRIVEPNPPWALALRGIGMVLMIAVALMGSFVYARRKQELEREVFNEATALTFFVVVVSSAAYGVVEVLLKAPHVPVVWVPVFAGFSWVVALIVVERRYT